MYVSHEVTPHNVVITCLLPLDKNPSTIELPPVTELIIFD